MTGRFTAACVQITAGRDPAANLEAASALVREAHAAGAELIATPESNRKAFSIRCLRSWRRPSNCA